MTETPAPHGRGDFEIRMRLRLERAGERFRAADGERRSALAELHAAVQDANGGVTARDAERLTGLPRDLLRTLQPELGEDPS